MEINKYYGRTLPVDIDDLCEFLRGPFSKYIRYGFKDNIEVYGLKLNMYIRGMGFRVSQVRSRNSEGMLVEHTTIDDEVLDKNWLRKHGLEKLVQHLCVDEKDLTIKPDEILDILIHTAKDREEARDKGVSFITPTAYPSWVIRFGIPY